MLSVFTDISEIKEREKELTRLNDGIEILPNGLMFWDANDNLIAHNKSAVNFLKGFGFKLEIGKSREDLREHMILNGHVKAPEKINKIAVETSADLLHQLIGAEINNSSISAIVDDLSKKKLGEYYGN